MTKIKFAIKAIAKKLDDSDFEVKNKAMQSLINICDEQVSYQETLISILKSEKNLSIKIDLLKIIGKIGLKETIPSLIEFCEDQDDNVRLQAVQVLGEVSVRTKDRVPNLF